MKVRDASAYSVGTKGGDVVSGHASSALSIFR
jgi:hypothetical protein